eukprot:2028236-Prymnesium_polylepis.1
MSDPSGAGPSAELIEATPERKFSPRPPRSKRNGSRHVSTEPVKTTEARCRCSNAKGVSCLRRESRVERVPEVYREMSVASAVGIEV